MLELIESLEEKIKGHKDIEEFVEEFVEAIENAADEGEIEFDDKVEANDILGRISETYSFDQDDESIEEDISKLRNILEGSY